MAKNLHDEPDTLRRAAPLVTDLSLAPLTGSLGYLLRRVQLLYKKHYLREAGRTGLPPHEVGAMYVIGLNPGATATQISVVLGLEAAQVATILKSLQLRRLIARKARPDDARSRALELTAAGRRRFAEVKALSMRVEAGFASEALTAAERTQLAALLTRLLGGVEGS